MKKGRGNYAAAAAFLLAVCLSLTAFPAFGQDEINKAKIFGEYYQLINDTDLYCSYFLYETGKPFPTIKIIGGELQNERSMFNDYDIAYINKGQADGMQIGQVFLVVSLGDKVGLYGTVLERRSRARIIRIDGDHMATVRLEKSCGGAGIGDYLVPFEEMEGEVGKDQGYGDLDPGAGVRGRLIYIWGGNSQASTDMWASINLGRQQCVQVGDRVSLFHRASPKLPREAIGSAIVIDVRGGSATIKLLSGRDAARVDDEVQIITSR